MTNTTSAPVPHTSSKLSIGTHVRVTTTNNGETSGVLVAEWQGPSFSIHFVIDAAPELGYRGGYVVNISGDRLKDVFVLDAVPVEVVEAALVEAGYHPNYAASLAVQVAA